MGSLSTQEGAVSLHLRFCEMNGVVYGYFGSEKSDRCSMVVNAVLKTRVIEVKEYFPVIEITSSLCPQQISATSSNLFKDSHAVRFIHLAFSADGYHVLNGGMSGSIDRSRIFTIITLCA